MDKSLVVTLIEGDGIGPEICAEVLKVLKATEARIVFEKAFAGQIALEKYGEVLPAATLRSIQKNRVALKGPLTTPIGEGFRSVNVLLRKRLDLFANIRPVRSIPGLSPHAEVDLVIFRENTEDLYAGIEYEVAPGVAVGVKVITRRASLRIAESAFAYAKRQRRRMVTAVHKANIMKLTDGLFLDCARQVAKKSPTISYNECIVDNACLQLVTRPGQFDILLLENLYGDILSDLCAGLVGGLGLVPGANIGSKYAVFEAVHGSAPDIAGKGVANPTAMLLTAALMLLHIGEGRSAAILQRAVEEVLVVDKVRTSDLGGSATTAQIGDAVAEKVREIRKRRGKSLIGSKP